MVARPLPSNVQALADATYFLPAYDQRQATLALAALREQQEATAAALQPRKRFAFNRKATKAANAPPAADVGARAGGAAEQPGSTSTASQQHRQQPQQTDLSGGVSGSAIRGLKGRVLALSREDAAGKEVTLSDLEDCVIYLLAPLAALFLAGLRRCKVYTGPVAGACFIEGKPASATRKQEETSGAAAAAHCSTWRPNVATLLAWPAAGGVPQRLAVQWPLHWC
jgi:hypothetical protein